MSAPNVGLVRAVGRGGVGRKRRRAGEANWEQ